jgi:hypothetical protein
MGSSQCELERVALLILHAIRKSSLMGQQLSHAGVAPPIATFSQGNDRLQLEQTIDGELQNLSGALAAAYSTDARAPADQRDAALKWLREWRDNCLTGPDRHTQLPCMMERCLERALVSGELVSVEVKFLCTLCPPWARQVLPEAPSETSTIGAWAATGAAICAQASQASARQFCAGIAISTIFAQLQGSPLHHVYDLLSKAFGDGINTPAAALTCLEAFDSLVTEVSNRGLNVPNEHRFLLKKDIFTQIVQVLQMVDGFFTNTGQQGPNETTLQCGANLVARCVELSIANTSVAIVGPYTLHPGFVDAFTQSALFDACLRQVSSNPTGAAARAACSLFTAVAALSNDPSEATHTLMSSIFGSVGQALTTSLSYPLDFDDADVEALIDVVTTFGDQLLETAANAAHHNNSPSAIAIINDLHRAMTVVLKLPTADPSKSSPVHACVAILARTLHPHRIPELEPGDAVNAEVMQEFEAGNRMRAGAAEYLRDSIYLPCLDHLFTFTDFIDAEWTEGIQTYVVRRSLAVARAVVATAPVASPSSRGPEGFPTEGEKTSGGADDDAGEATRRVDVVGGDAVENFAAAVNAVTALVGNAPFPANDWLPLAMAHEAFQDPTVATFVQDRAAHMRFTSHDDALLLAAAQALRNSTHVNPEQAAVLAGSALEAASSVRSPSFLAAAYCLTAVVAGCEGVSSGTVQQLAVSLFNSRTALCKTAPLPRYDDPTAATGASVHYLYRLAASRVCTTLATVGSMQNFGAVALSEETVLRDQVGGLSVVVDSLWVLRTAVALGGPSDGLVTALRQAIIKPVFFDGFFASWISKTQSMPSELDRTACRRLCDEFASLFAATCENLSPPCPKALYGLSPDYISNQLAELCGNSGWAVAVAVVAPLCELSGDSEMGSLPSTVFEHVAAQLPHMPGHAAIECAAAMFRAFTTMATRVPQFAQSCARTVHTAASVMLPALANYNHTDLSVDWVTFKSWLTWFAATLEATAHLSQYSSEYAVPPDAVVNALRVMALTCRSRDAINTAHTDEDGAEEEWSVFDTCCRAALTAVANWCAAQPDGFAALTQMGHACSRSKADSTGALNGCSTVTDAADAFMHIIKS